MANKSFFSEGESRLKLEFPFSQEIDVIYI